MYSEILHDMIGYMPKYAGKLINMAISNTLSNNGKYFERKNSDNKAISLVGTTIIRGML